MRIDRIGNFTFFCPQDWKEDVAVTILELPCPAMVYDEITRSFDKKEEITPYQLEQWASKLSKKEKAQMMTYTWRIDTKTKVYFTENENALKLTTEVIA